MIPEALVPRFVTAGWATPDGSPTAAAAGFVERILRGPEPDETFQRLVDAVQSIGPQRILSDRDLADRLIAVCAASRALTRWIVTHPAWLTDDPPSTPELADHPLRGVRRFVQRRLLATAVRDLLGFADMPAVGAELAATADAAAAAALAIAGDDIDVPIPFTVIAMGKWGGQELNYASDIDVLFVYDTPDGLDPDTARTAANQIAGGFIAALADVTPDGVAYRVDADLRPEGRNGPLARSLSGYTAYYERWAQPWEYQALIKARPAAGDPDLGRRFIDLIQPHVYPDTLDPDTLRTIRTMKARIETEAARRGIADREIKRGIGGIRDIEFAVQLLQLVHGRFDTALRQRSTLGTLQALVDGGYVRSDDAEALADSYRWLRTLEHRIQLYDLRQTHTLPVGERERERLAKAMGYVTTPDGEALRHFETDLARHRSRVRHLHEALFYRPLLESFAASPAVRLSADGTTRQLAALGFRDADATRRAVADLTTGLSRRSQLMRQLLPLMLDWLSESPDPDLGLEQLRLFVAATSKQTTLVSTLRDLPVAAERLCYLLGSGRLLGRLLDRIPEMLPTLGDDTALAAPSRPDVAETVGAVMLRPNLPERLRGVRRFVQRRLLATAVRDLLGFADMPAVGAELAATADAAAAAALAIAGDDIDVPIPFTVIAMGKWGGQELNYASDIDVLFVYDTPDGLDPDTARTAANQIAGGFIAALADVTPDGVAYRVDADLRPEGRNGPLARSLSGYTAYYERWAQPWEYQALIKARPAAGDPDLGRRFIDLIQPHVYPDTLDPDTLRTIRTMKARIETERIPRGVDPDRHLKLGPGAITDIEFFTQLCQLRYGHEHPNVRRRGTLEALRALVDVGVLRPAHAATLADAYRLTGQIRNRLFLQAGHPTDVLPGGVDLVRLARSLGYAGATDVREALRRATRRARRLVERGFYRDEL